MARVPDYHRMSYSDEARRATRGVHPDNYIYHAENLGRYLAAGVDEIANELKRQQKQQQAIAEKAAMTQTAANVERNLAVIANKHKTDPEGFKQEAETQKAEWLKQVPADKSQEYNLLFSQQQANFDSAIVRNQISQANEYQKATFFEASENYRNQAMKAARLGDSQLQQQNYQDFLQNREALFSAGYISAERYVAMGEDFANNVETQAELGKFEKIMPQGDPAIGAYIQNFEKRQDLTPQRKAAISNALAAEYSNYKTKQRLMSEESLKQADFVIKALDSGIMPGVDPNDLSAKLRQMGNAPAAAKVEQSQRLYYEVREFAKLTPPQMAENLQSTKENLKQPEDLARFAALSKFYQTSLAQLEKDPLSYAANYGIIEDSGFDLNDPDKAKTRIANAEFLQAKYNLPDLPVISPAELHNLNMTIAQTDSAGKANLLAQIYNNYGDSAEQVFKGLAPKNPEFAHAASVYNANPQIAKNLLEGAEIASQQTEYMPKSNDDFDSAYYNVIGPELFADAAPEWREGIKKSVKDYMAKLNFDNGKTDRQVDRNTVKEAVTAVIGDIVSYDRAGWFNGGFKTVAPLNATAAEFTDWFDSLEDDRFQSAVTIEGFVPTAQEIRDYGTLSFYGNGKYRIFINGYPLYTPDGKPFVLNYDWEG